jgi:ubiquinone/menaquinone biosynthesis C-methylase UbiE
VDQDIAQHWEELFSTPSWLHAHHIAKCKMRERFIKRLNFEDVHRCLDVACGIGGWTSLLQKSFPDAQVIGIDYAADTLHDNLSAKKYGPQNSHFIATDVHLLPFLDNTFDLTLVSNCLPYFRDTRLALSEIVRATAPEGHIILRNYDDALINIHPCAPELIAKVIFGACDFANKAGREFDHFGRNLKSITKDHHIFIETHEVEHILFAYPFDQATRNYISGNVRHLGARASHLLTDHELRAWLTTVDETSENCIFNRLDGHYAMADYVVIGRKET